MTRLDGRLRRFPAMIAESLAIAALVIGGARFELHVRVFRTAESGNTG